MHRYKLGRRQPHTPGTNGRRYVQHARAYSAMVLVMIMHSSSTWWLRESTKYLECWNRSLCFSYPSRDERKRASQERRVMWEHAYVSADTSWTPGLRPSCLRHTLLPHPYSPLIPCLPRLLPPPPFPAYRAHNPVYNHAIAQLPANLNWGWFTGFLSVLHP